MLLYHGTPGPMGQKIITERVIKNNCNRLWNGSIQAVGEKIDISTTDGLVYFSNKLSLASFYGNANRWNCKEKTSLIYVFRVNIPEEELLPDWDELKINWEQIVRKDITAEQSLSICSCVSVDHSIKADKYNIEYIEIDMLDDSSELSEKIIELCREYKNNMEPDPEDLVNEIDVLGKWIRL